MLDVESIRRDFPILNQKVYGKSLIYLDNGATTHKPMKVMDKIIDFYSSKNSNIHRGVHYLSEQSRHEYEQAREIVKKFINAESITEIVFTSGATESINLVAESFGAAFIKPGDEIIITAMEHHSNILPWQKLCQQRGARLKVIPVDDNGVLELDIFKEIINDRTALVSLTYVSNVTGVINDVKTIIDIAHSHDIPVLVDGAQAVQHMKVDMKELDCDFFIFSGHKMYAETGIGVLYGKEKWLEKMPPYKCGGGMINSVSFDKIEYAGLPIKFEAGTVNFVGAITLGTAIEYIMEKGVNKIERHENQLVDYCQQRLKEIEAIEIYGGDVKKTGAISFNLRGVHNYDGAMVLDKQGIAIRSGTHCAEPLMKRLGLDGTMRASFGIYNTKEEVDRLIDGIKRVRDMFES